MIIYFADRSLEVLGHASTGLPGGVTITDDNRTDDVETGVSIFECKVNFTKKTRADVETWTEVGNYLLRSGDKDNKFYTIIDAEIDTKKQTVYVYAEDDGMDLLNEVAGAYTADKAYPIAHYINMWATGAGWEIGINEVDNLTRQLSWDSESTATARIGSIAEQFDNAEISYSFETNGFAITKKYINIYQKRGSDNGVTLRLNYELDNIIVTKSISNLATALYCTGGTPDDADQAITLDGFAYDDGDFYVDGTVLKSRNALEKWHRYFWKSNGSNMAGGHITKMYSCDALSQDALFASALDELKKYCDMEVNYEAEIKKMPDNLEVGDRVNIVDDAGHLYLSTRLLTLETSVADQTCNAVFGEYIIKGSGISERVAALAAQFAKTSQSAARATAIASNAQDTASNAQQQADAAAAVAATATQSAGEATAAAAAATQSAQTAQAAAAEARAAVNSVEQTVESVQSTVANAEQAAANAQQAATTAQQKATEAAASAANASAEAAEVLAAIVTAQNEEDTALANAAAAQATADTAKADAAAAQQTATAAKQDAAQAKADIAALGDDLKTLENTMVADYARKTDLTEAKASLQTQISQNAAQISSTATKVQEIDETANNAAELAAAAQSGAASAQEQAGKAKEDAAAAQTAAANAATAAANAQSEADTAKAAAATAQSVADKAQADLEAAQADLATVTDRVDATEADIAEAQAAVNTAQAAADKANADATAAATKAENAQSAANSATEQAATAQTAANSAATQAALAQKTADEAKGDASAAQAKANEAAETAAEAQRTANAATTNAANAQTVADAAALAAENAQKAANDADTKAEQAAADLTAAQQNLAAVTSRVDATEDEVAAAQAAVETARAAANEAKQNAATAQATANTAKANAATAQTVANNAKTAADNAQAAAEEAQAAADDAQAAVDDLAVRVTTAETNISQNAEQIALMAKKTEVTQTLGGYYTKEEANAAIQVSAAEITSSVSSTYATNERITSSETLIQQLSNCIATLVTDENGETLMTQTENGWTFSMKETSEAVSDLMIALETLQKETGSTKATIDVLQQAVSDHGKTLDYVNVTTYEDEPCIELGESDSDFKLLITNTRIMFMHGSNVPTYINTNGLVTQNIEVKGEIVQGGYVMMNTADGGWGLLWKGGNS